MQIGLSTYFDFKSLPSIAVEKAAANGFRLLELSLWTPDHYRMTDGELPLPDQEIDRLLELKEKKGLTYLTIHLPFLKDYFNISSPISWIRTGYMKQTKKYINLAKILGCKYVLIHPGEEEPPQFEPITSREDYLKWTIEHLQHAKECCKMTELQHKKDKSNSAINKMTDKLTDHSEAIDTIEIITENLHTLGFGNNTEDLQRILEAVDIKTVVDFSHLFLQKDTNGQKRTTKCIYDKIKNYLERIEPRIAYFHMNGNNGSIDLHNALPGADNYDIVIRAIDNLLLLEKYPIILEVRDLDGSFKEIIESEKYLLKCRSDTQ